MFIALSILVGLIFAAAVYLLLRRSIVLWMLGLAMIGHAANLAIFTAAGLRRGTPPLIESGEQAARTGSADPLPQALVLTAIVIGFALTAFAAVLAWRAFEEVGTDDLDDMRTTDTDDATTPSEHASAMEVKP